MSIRKIWNDLKGTPPKVRFGWEMPTRRDFEVIFFGPGKYAQVAWQIAKAYGQPVTDTHRIEHLAGAPETYTDVQNLGIISPYTLKQYKEGPLLISAWRNDLGTWGIRVDSDGDLALGYTQRASRERPDVGIRMDKNWRYNLLDLLTRLQRDNAASAAPLPFKP